MDEGSLKMLNPEHYNVAEWSLYLFMIEKIASFIDKVRDRARKKRIEKG